MAEFLAAANKRFKEMDKNGDGIITIEEYGLYLRGKKEATKK